MGKEPWEDLRTKCRSWNLINRGGHRSRLFFERRYLKRRFLPGPAVVLFLRIYSPEAMAACPVSNRKGLVKSLKIRPPAIRPIDIVLRRSAVTWFVSTALATSYARCRTLYSFLKKAPCRTSGYLLF